MAKTVKIQKTKKPSKKIEKTVIATDHKVTMLDIKDIVPQVMSNIIIRVIDGYQTLLLPDNMTGDKYKTFKKSRGGVFARDVLAFSRGKEHGKYFLLKSPSERFIGRIVNEDELLMFQALKLIDGKLVDANYMKLRDLGEDEKLTNSVRYIKNNDQEDEIMELIITEEVELAEDSVEEPTSISLFDE